MAARIPDIAYVRKQIVYISSEPLFLSFLDSTTTIESPIASLKATAAICNTNIAVMLDYSFTKPSTIIIIVRNPIIPLIKRYVFLL